MSKNTRHLPYGSGALKAISDQLLKEMPGLRGFSATSLKKMRLFYEQWQILDINSSNASDEFEETDNQSIIESSVITDNLPSHKSSVATDNLQTSSNQIDIYNAITISNLTDFPVEVIIFGNTIKKKVHFILFLSF